jgi:peptide/nickel transport system permease protein
MMLDQNENSEQLALIKKKYGFDKPIATQYLYYINDLSPLSLHSKNESDYTYLSEGKYNAAPLFSFYNLTWSLRLLILEKVSRKVERKYRK